ncbi:hypothetical protein [Actinocrispum sp. NPDC049592]|uniref:hypothetical protein n=1 Tax=Actinocrispum sp. NPDC049592 TaxID=3154835 RepID=UPI003420D7CA
MGRFGELGELGVSGKDETTEKLRVVDTVREADGLATTERDGEAERFRAPDRDAEPGGLAVIGRDGKAEKLRAMGRFGVGRRGVRAQEAAVAGRARVEGVGMAERDGEAEGWEVGCEVEGEGCEGG